MASGPRSPDPDRLLQRADEDLAITDVPGIGSFYDGLHNPVDRVFPDRDLDQDLRKEIDLPIYPVKGVSITMPSRGWESPVQMPVIDEGRLFALAPLGDRVRVVGSAEVAGYDTTPSPVRCRAIVDNAISVFPGLRDCYDADRAELWAGLRPVTPSGTPLLGATPIANLFLNTGHCHQGWTLSCGSGRVVADLVDGREPEIDLGGLLW